MNTKKNTTADVEATWGSAWGHPQPVDQNRDECNLMSHIASRRTLVRAYEWLRARRLHSSANDSFWSLSRNWPRVRGQCRHRLQSGDFTLSPVAQYQLARAHRVAYVRYKDDIVILCRTRHQLKRMIKRVDACCDELGLKLALDKTWVGRAEKGFDFLGYRISPQGLTVATRSWDRFTEKLHRLFEQGAMMSRRLQYVKHWIRWPTAGVSCDLDALILKTKYIFRTQFNFNSTCIVE